MAGTPAAVPSTPAGDAAPSSGAAAAAVTREEVAALAQQIGDMLADLAGLRSELAAAQAAALAPGKLSASAGGAPAAGGGKEADVGGVPANVLAGMARELAALKEGLDMVAHSANIMAVGLEPPRMLAKDEGGAGNGGAAGGAGGAGPAPGLVGGKEPRVHRGALERLVKLLGRQSVAHKLDWFDPTALNQMSQKLGMVEALLQNQHMQVARPGLPDAGMKDLEAQLRRLSREVRAMKDRQGDGGAGALGTGRLADGDHAMLSGKPLLGYRCMACDRPLDKLNDKPGPVIPTAQMPVRVHASPDVSNKVTSCCRTCRASRCGRRQTRQSNCGLKHTRSHPAARHRRAGGHDEGARGGRWLGHAGELVAGEARRPSWTGRDCSSAAHVQADPHSTQATHACPLCPAQGKFIRKAGYDNSQRWPQNWYEDAKGLPAEALPAQDVGPKLAPGGWRASHSGVRRPADHRC